MENHFCWGDILSSYELKILPQLEELAGIIIDTASDVKLSLTLREWRKLARPLIISAKAIGIENTNLRNQAEEIFYAVREKAVKLHNEHHKTREALKLILMLKESVADISARLSDMANNDIRELEKLEREKIQAEREYEDYKSSIYYETEFGLIFKDKFRISSDGISWKGVNTPLDEVYGMKWGGIRKYVNGMYMRTDYKITLQTPYITVNLAPNEKKHNEIVPRLWRALAGSISAGILKQLQAGELLFFGGIKIKDNGVYLKKSGWFSSDVQFFTWRDPIITYSNNGMFIIEAGEYSASSSYINDMNTHILEAMLQNFLRNPKSKRLRLSSLLDSH